MEKNKKQCPQLKNWFLTWNNYDEKDPDLLEMVMKPLCKRYVFELEVGASGTPHIQGCFELLKAMRPTEFNLPKTLHWEKTRNNIRARAYCVKEGNEVRQFPLPNKKLENQFARLEHVDFFYKEKKAELKGYEEKSNSDYKTFLAQQECCHSIQKSKRGLYCALCDKDFSKMTSEWDEFSKKCL